MAAFRTLSDHGTAQFGENDYDVRDWKVRGRSDEEVGRVHDVLTDDRGRARYFDVELDGGRHVLMPAGEGRLHPNDRSLHVGGLDRSALSNLPEYDHRPDSVTPEYERDLTSGYDRAYGSEGYYDRPDYAAAWSRSTGRSRGEIGRVDRLDDVDVASGEADPRGWEVRDAAGERLGKVDHLIGDTGTMKVRYLTVELDDDVVSERRHVLMPVGHVDLDRDDERVLTRGMDRTTVGTLPAYTGGSIDRDYETDLNRRYAEAYSEDRRYEHPRYRSRVMDTRR